MKFPHLQKITFKKETSIKTILEGFNETAIHTENNGFAIIIDDNGSTLGVVTDGDIRRVMLKGVTIEDTIGQAMNKNFIFVSDHDSFHKVLRQFEKNILNLPVLNENKMLIDLYQYSKFVASTRSENSIIRARVPVRMSFSGGGTDMSSYFNKFDSLVLSSTINKYCTASIISRSDKKIIIRSKDLNLEYRCDSFEEIQLGDELDLIKHAIKIMQPQFGFELETYAEFEKGTGLGGSSAVVVSVIGAFNYFRNNNQLGIYDIADIAYQVERIDMKISGGWQDQYATSFGGFNCIEFKKNEVIVTPLRLRKETVLELEYNLMLFRLGESRESSKIQKNHISRIKKNKLNTQFENMTKLSIMMKDALLRNQVKTFADLLDESWQLKKKMNNKISNDLIQDCYKTAKELGALGGKLLGAGGSGYLLLYSSPLYQKNIKSALEKKGAVQEPFKFCNKGLEVWSTPK